MNAIFTDVLQRIPEYTTFLTADELDESSRKLAKTYPDVVQLFSMGQTRAGKDILCLKIGKGQRNALMFGCPHPNEPIGTMMLEYFSKELAENAAFREELGYTWYIVKAWDRDGLVLNEGWLKGPYTIYNYSRNFFRPAGHQQVDWTFPVEYKKLNFTKAIPETTAMMALIDEIQPEFIYSLHNAGFGGVYWYVTEALDETTYAQLRKVAEKAGIPLHLGEPEVPYLKELAPAVYPILSIKSEYDYLEKYGDGTKSPEELITSGDCSSTYAHDRYNSFTLLTELPYFYDERIKDLTVTEHTRKDVVLQSLAHTEKSNIYIQDILERTKDLIAEDNPFRLALRAFSQGEQIESTKRHIESADEYQRKATVAEVFDNLELTLFYKSLSYGMAIRQCEYELERRSHSAGEEKQQKLLDFIAITEREHRLLTEELEAMLDYQVIPIAKLIYIQLACGLLVCDFLKERRS